MLKHGGLAANGHCVAFQQEASEPGKIFPKLLSEVNIIMIRKQGKMTPLKSLMLGGIKESIENAANKKGQVCIPWPTRKNEALSEFTTRQFFSLAFPCLFPCGNGDVHLNPARTCTSLSD